MTAECVALWSKPEKQLGVSLIAEKCGCETAKKYTCIFRFFTTWILSFNKYECIYGTNTYKHTVESGA